jgi:hypothetical protein
VVFGRKDVKNYQDEGFFMMHPEIQAFWDKIADPIGLYDSSFALFQPNIYYQCKGSFRCIYMGEANLYWYHPTWDGHIGKWYSEKEMLKIIKLQPFA